ncbi:hypothetical protein, no similarity [Maudiozyma saulgeensis]|uniref:Uncharacterized protein n=1 Tax=Maudiozyma saulgeensis TaxID=1789683 RepID=A0A1X7QZ96_9SACH|nr:hypothetical protein, no similarity [Kazachstania saulgeensis]
MNNLLYSSAIYLLLMTVTTSAVTPQYSNETTSTVVSNNNLFSELGFSVENINVGPNAVIMTAQNNVSTSSISTTYYTYPTNASEEISTTDGSATYKNRNSTLISLSVLSNITSSIKKVGTQSTPSSGIVSNSYNTTTMVPSGSNNNSSTQVISNFTSALPSARYENTNYTTSRAYGNGTSSTTNSMENTTSTTKVPVSNITASQIGYSNVTFTTEILNSSLTFQRQAISSIPTNSSSAQFYANSTMSSDTPVNTPTEYLNATSTLKLSTSTNYLNSTSSVTTKAISISYNSSVSESSISNPNTSSSQVVFYNSSRNSIATSIIAATSSAMNANKTSLIVNSSLSSIYTSTAPITKTSAVTTQWALKNESLTQSTFSNISSNSIESSRVSIQSSNMTSTSNQLTLTEPHFDNATATPTKQSTLYNSTISIPGGMANINITYSIVPVSSQQDKDGDSVTISTSSYVTPAAFSSYSLNSTIPTSVKFGNSSTIQSTSSYSAIVTGVSVGNSTYQTGQNASLTINNTYTSTTIENTAANYGNKTSTTSTFDASTIILPSTDANKDANSKSATILSQLNVTLLNTVSSASTTSSIGASVVSSTTALNSTQSVSSAMLGSSLGPINNSQNYYMNTSSVSSIMMTTVPTLTGQNNNVNPTGSLQLEPVSSKSNLNDTNSSSHLIEISLSGSSTLSFINSQSETLTDGTSKLTTSVASTGPKSTYVYDIDPTNPRKSSNISSISTAVEKDPSNSTYVTAKSSRLTTDHSTGVVSVSIDSIQVSKSQSQRKSSILSNLATSSAISDPEVLSSIIDSITLSSTTDERITSTSTSEGSIITSHIGQDTESISIEPKSYVVHSQTITDIDSTIPSKSIDSNHSTPIVNTMEHASSSVKPSHSVSTNRSNNETIEEHSTRSGSQVEYHTSSKVHSVDRNNFATASVSDLKSDTTMSSATTQFETDSSFITSSATRYSATSTTTHSPIKYTGSASNVIINFGQVIIIPIIMTILFM